MKKYILILMFMLHFSSVNAQVKPDIFSPLSGLIKIGQNVDVDLNIYSDKDLAYFHTGIKRDCKFMGISGNMYMFEYDGDKIIIPSNSIKMIIVKQ